MGKYWGIFFGATMAACGIFTLAAVFIPGWWQPLAASKHSPHIDFLFDFIWLIVGFFFVLTEAILAVFLYRFATTADGSPPKPGPSVFTKMAAQPQIAMVVKPMAKMLDQPHKIELAWTIVPAAILLFISFYQVNTWANVKYQSRFPEEVKQGTPVVAAISSRQFEWRMRYPNKKRMEEFFKAPLDSKDYLSFATVPQFSDVETVNELHVYKDYPVLIHLSTLDVIHSFNLPNMRVKQDALPGKIIPVWFIPNRSNTRPNRIKKDGTWVDGYNPETQKEGDPQYVWDLACAELCGWGHFRMVGRIYVHETKEDFLDWLEHAEKAQKKRD